MSNEQVDDIMKMFDLDSGSGADTNDYSSTAEVNEGDKPDFDDLAQQVGDEIADEGKGITELNTTNTTDESNESNESNEQEKTSAEDIIKQSISSSEDSENSEDDNFDLDSVFDEKMSSRTKGNEDEVSKDNSGVSESEASKDARNDSPVEEGAASEGSPEEQPVPFDTADGDGSSDAKETEDSEVKVKQGVKFIDGKLQWMLEAPTDKYEPFYQSKSEALDVILPDGQVPFDQYKRELKEARVDLNVSSSDFDELYDRMREIQKWKERVTTIAIHVNEQYYMWERFVDLLKGVLARTEYEKPALKQDGVVFQHMRDMELYHSELKMLHNTVNSVLKNLDSAWDTLSRTVTMALKEQERSTTNRYQSKANKESSSESQEDSVHQSSSESIDEMLEEFDGLEGEAAVGSSREKTGSQTLDWDEL